MKKIYVIKYKMINSGFGNGPREQIIEAKNEARAVIKFNRKNKEYIRWMNNISIKEITNK
jgi:hypothetical protein